MKGEGGAVLKGMAELESKKPLRTAESSSVFSDQDVTSRGLS